MDGVEQNLGLNLYSHARQQRLGIGLTKKMMQVERSRRAHGRLRDLPSRHEESVAPHKRGLVGRLSLPLLPFPKTLTRPRIQNRVMENYFDALIAARKR